MSMQDGQGQVTDTADPTVTDPGTSTDPGTQDPDLSNHPFLQDVDEADRAIVARYHPRWEANVQRRFAKLNEQMDPYKNLGDLETLQQARELYRLANENPAWLYEQLHSKLSQDPSFAQRFSPQQQQQLPGQGLAGQTQYPEELAQYFQPWEQKFSQFASEQSQVIKTLEAVAGAMLEMRQTAQQQQEDSVLDSELDLLHQEFGDFDEKYVLTSMFANGGDGEAAVREWKAAVQQGINGTRAPAVGPVLSGSGSPPPGGKSPAELSNRETRDLVAQVLAANAAGRNQ